jgi:CubicO group peptidase (beta-lactamase class C family)
MTVLFREVRMSEFGLPWAESPEQVGLSSARLERLASAIHADVARKLIPGAVLAIARGGRLGYAEAFGWRDREAGAPMAADAIFRVASMTKPITSVAAMMLAEEGRLEIAAPVAQYLPEFAEPTVGAERRKAHRVMTVQDLLRHTSGLTYAQFGDTPVQMIWRDAKLMDEDQTSAELVAKLAGLPLMFEPGTTWEYSMSTDVLGRVVEVVSGESLAEFFAEQICRPLGMADTGFAATGERAARLPSRRTIRRPAYGRQCATSRATTAGIRAAAARSRPRPITCASARCC